MFLDLSLFGLGGRHLLVGGGVSRRGVWRLLICLAVSFGLGGSRGGEEGGGEEDLPEAIPPVRPITRCKL
jgi:hypothetical protein